MSKAENNEGELRGFSAMDLRVINEELYRLKHGGESRGACKRVNTRYTPAHTMCRARIEHGGGSGVDRLVYVVDLSTNGIGLIHHGYIHLNTTIRVEMLTTDGERVYLRGTVRWCSYLSGNLHMLGLQLVEPANPKHFVDSAVWLSQPEDNVDRYWSVRRRALYMNDEPLEHGAMKMLLENANIDCIPAATVGAALDSVDTGQFDLVIMEDQVDGTGCEEVVHSLQSRLYAGPVAVLTTNRGRVEDQAIAAGANVVIDKPVQLNTMLTILRDLFEESEDPTNGSSPVYTSLSTEQCSNESLSGYLGAVADMAHKLNTCIAADDTAGALKICRSLHSTGAGYGFEMLSDTAGAAVNALNASASVLESKSDVRRLIRMIGRLRGRDGGGMAA